MMVAVTNFGAWDNNSSILRRNWKLLEAMKKYYMSVARMCHLKASQLL